MRNNFSLKSTALFCALATFHSFAWADLIVPANGLNTLNPGFVSLACTDLTVSGQLNLSTGSLVLIKNSLINAGGTINGDSGLLEVNGNWANAGTFNAGASTVRFTRACGVDTVHVTGITHFANLTIDSRDGTLHINLPPYTNQTVSGALVFSGNPKNIRIEGGPCSGIQLLGEATSSGQDANVQLAPGVWIGKTPPTGCPGGPPPAPAESAPVPATSGTVRTLLAVLLATLGAGSLGRRRRPPRP